MGLFSIKAMYLQGLSLTQLLHQRYPCELHNLEMLSRVISLAQCVPKDYLGKGFKQDGTPAIGKWLKAREHEGMLWSQ